jgi:hypothetical protein
MDRVTPQELHAELDRVRRDQGLALWQVALQMDVTTMAIYALKRGTASPAVQARAAAWLERHTGPSRQE